MGEIQEVGSSRTFVLGDVHGAYRALRQCFEKAHFNFDHDHLICLGDVCDGWPDTRLCIDEILKVKHLTYIMGNHDMMMLNWMMGNPPDDAWLSQGGEATRRSYSGGIPDSHVVLIVNALPYFLLNDRLYVHAGFDPALPLNKQPIETFCWDRRLAKSVLDAYEKDFDSKLVPYAEVYIGHTPIPFSKPIHAGGVWMMDTGAGWSGPLSLMNVVTKDLFTSDRVPGLYPGIKGRSG